MKRFLVQKYKWNHCCTFSMVTRLSLFHLLILPTFSYSLHVTWEMVAVNPGRGLFFPCTFWWWWCVSKAWLFWVVEQRTGCLRGDHKDTAGFGYVLSLFPTSWGLFFGLWMNPVQFVPVYLRWRWWANCGRNRQGEEACANKHRRKLLLHAYGEGESPCLCLRTNVLPNPSNW